VLIPLIGILNGTAFSASVAALALNDAVHLTLLAQVCTAMGTEALMGSRGSFAPFIHSVARPHPGQVRLRNSVTYSTGISRFHRLNVLKISGICWKAVSSRQRMRRKSVWKKTSTRCVRIVIPFARHLSSWDLRSKISSPRSRLSHKNAIQVILLLPFQILMVYDFC
jgi:hypothetical protein